MIYLNDNLNYESKLIALKWFSLSAKQGLPEAQYNLASMYFDGVGVVQDFTKAFKYFLMSAENGLSISQYQLSEMYSNGWGVNKSTIKSFMWANISASQGHEESINKRNQLLSELKNEEIQKGQKLSLECFSKKLKNC